MSARSNLVSFVFVLHFLAVGGGRCSVGKSTLKEEQGGFFGSFSTSRGVTNGSQLGPEASCVERNKISETPWKRKKYGLTVGTEN